MHEDGQLIAQIRRGDLRAFEALYNKYRSQVYRAALAITNDTGAAEDILQDCFLRLHANIDRIDGSTPISPWLHRVTVNLAYNYVAKRKRRANPAESVFEALHATANHSMERHVESAATRDEVQEAIDSLSLPHRVVITLFYLSEFSIEEIAYILDCPVGTVKSRLHYARNILRKRLMGDVATMAEAMA
ncbi:MAG: RNA polymerase sigma factor [Caldilineae bacterium]|nr:RNA polymerase sigma factor [Anaerolineae bacterium]MCB0198733.1 RNA polymerase sigma factor [Anaerolineae bacterium]MCB0204268.1 RNA polymerase sigma factor [Anaerolineae bacterium]MCB0254689.1 RNA polymerase sigma factor [Anaerolineae bacterium]MCB9154013.1 RNA polymerase sigma factor [Caldilineae bacterium]